MSFAILWYSAGRAVSPGTLEGLRSIKLLEWPAGAAGRRQTRSDCQAEICSDPPYAIDINPKIRICDRILMLQVLRWWETAKPNGKVVGTFWAPGILCRFASSRSGKEGRRKKNWHRSQILGGSRNQYIRSKIFKKNLTFFQNLEFFKLPECAFGASLLGFGNLAP